MTEENRFRWTDLFWFLIIVALAAGSRIWYLQNCLDVASTSTPLPFIAQSESKLSVTSDELDREESSVQETLATNILLDQTFYSIAPLANQPEDTAHVSPGYPAFIAVVRMIDDANYVALLRWLQCGLGALTAGFYFLFARRAFQNVVVALLAGLFCAFHPLYVVNTAQVNDGVLTTFLLASVLFLGTRAGQLGAIFSSLLFGLALAGLCLVRAVLLPFGVIGLIYFLLKCRSLERGWLCGLLAVLGFVNGVAPWGVRNFKVHDEIIPIVDSAYVHLYKGNNANSDGGPQNEDTMRAALGVERVDELLAIKNQPKRYQELAFDVIDHVKEHPTQTVRNRIWAGLYFWLGKNWFSNYSEDVQMGQNTSATDELPEWLTDNYALMVQSVLLGMLVLGMLGWRWTYAWHSSSGLAAIAAICIPIPYVLSYGDHLWGPRLPLDGLLLTYSACAIIYFLPVVRGNLAKGPDDL